MIYLAVFGLSTLLFYVAGKCRGALFVMLATAAILLPCVMAGLRGPEVGTDVMTYGIWTFQAASDSSLLEFLKAYAGISPIGFNLMSWTVTRLFGSFEIYLGIIQLLTILPTYLAARYLYRNKEWLCMLCYFLLLYATSLNTMKQSIAVAISLVAIIYALKRRPAAYCAVILLAMSFHETAIISILIYPMLLLFANSNSKKKLFGRWRALVLVTFGLVAVTMLFVFGEQLVRFFSQFKDSYDYQVDHIGAGSANDSMLVVAVAAVFAWRLCRGLVTNSSTAIEVLREGAAPGPLALYDFIFAIFLLGCVCSQLNIISESAGRVGYYFLAYGGAFVSSLAFDTNERGRPVALAIVTLLVVYFVFAFIVRGGSEIYPYVTSEGIIFQ